MQGLEVGWVFGPYALRVRALGRDLAFDYDDTADLATYRVGATYTAGRIGLCVGYASGNAYWDDFVVRKYVSPEPTVTAQPEESSCP